MGWQHSASAWVWAVSWPDWESRVRIPVRIRVPDRLPDRNLGRLGMPAGQSARVAMRRMLPKRSFVPAAVRLWLYLKQLTARNAEPPRRPEPNSAATAEPRSVDVTGPD